MVRGDDFGQFSFQTFKRAFRTEARFFVDIIPRFRYFCNSFLANVKMVNGQVNTMIPNDWGQANCSILLGEVKDMVRKLRSYGVQMADIAAVLHEDDPMPELVITHNYRILIGEKRQEIKMEPLVKAVYLLFLKHPEGILFKHLPDYREELTEIYVKLKPYGLSDRVVQSIEDVTNPLLNSINEKCARIRGAFLGQFDNHLAKHYYIDGNRGEAKKIALPRDLVVWE